MAAETTRIRITVAPYEGEYEVLDQALSTKEWRWIKQLSGGELRAGTFDADVFGDPDFILALAVIAMRRAGKITADQVLSVADELSEVPFDGVKISLIIPTAEVDEDEVPLASTSEPSGSSASGSLENEHSKPPSSRSTGSDSTPASEVSDGNHEPTGTSRSGTFSTFDLTSLTR